MASSEEETAATRHKATTEKLMGWLGEKPIAVTEDGQEIFASEPIFQKRPVPASSSHVPVDVGTVQTFVQPNEEDARQKRISLAEGCRARMKEVDLKEGN